MPTKGRREWAAEAVEMFIAQTYPLKQIIIVDELKDPSFPDHWRLFDRLDIYFHKYSMTGNVSLGGKRNRACAKASGQIIMHWDSDDRYTPDRMERQVGQLIASGVDMVGYHIMPWFESDGLMRRGVFRGLPEWPLGVSFCYWRDSWENAPFADLQTEEDNEFRDRRTFKSFDSEGRITMRVHDGNTSDKKTPMGRDSSMWGIAA